MGQALRYVLFLTCESMILQCKQSLFLSFESQHIRARTRGEKRSHKVQASSAPISPPLYH